MFFIYFIESPLQRWQKYILILVLPILDSLPASAWPQMKTTSLPDLVHHHVHHQSQKKNKIIRWQTKQLQYFFVFLWICTSKNCASSWWFSEATPWNRIQGTFKGLGLSGECTLHLSTFSYNWCSPAFRRQGGGGLVGKNCMWTCKGRNIRRGFREPLKGVTTVKPAASCTERSCFHPKQTERHKEHVPHLSVCKE